ncbi:Rhs repeat-containing protein, partial [Buttiauxella brennerae ATCC 51605]
MTSFTPNGTLGQICTLVGAGKPLKMLTKQPGICEAYLKSVFKEYDKKNLLQQMGDKDYQADEQAGRSFRNQCEALPDQMPEQILDDLRTQLNDYIDRNVPPQEIYRIRHLHNLYENVYRPGPRLDAPITDAEQQWLLQSSNTLVIALLGPPFNLPALATVIAGGTPQQVSGALETGALLSNMTGIAAAFHQKPTPGLFVKQKIEIQGKGSGKSNNLSLCRGDPVDVGTGSLLQQLSVLTLPGSLPLTLSRAYRSCAGHGGVFGPKWTDEWSASLTVHDGDLHFTDGEGVVLYYPIPQDGIFHDALNSRQAHFRLAGDIHRELTVFDRRSQQTRVFSASCSETYLLSAIYDRSGNRIDFIRTDSLLTDIRHSDGYTLALDWQNQQLMSIDLVTPQHQRLVTCHYDSNGFLAECDTFQFSHLWHEYSPEGYMTRWRDTDKTCVDIVYDAQGRVLSTLSTEGYYSDHFVYNDEEKCTTYQDAEGGESHYWYDEDGLVTRSTDPLGREEISIWDNTRLLSRTDALGRTTEYRYNEEGDIRQVALPGGHSLRYEYNDAGQLTQLTAPGNQVWLWAYDDHGSMVSLTDPQGRSQQFSYSEQGNLLQRITPGGATWHWDYNALHQVRQTTAPDGGVTHTEQDILGRLLSVKDPLGFTTQFRHSKKHAGPQGSVEEINRPDGVRELMRHNSEKLPESVADGEGKTTRYEYGAFDLLTAVIRPDGERLECRYDKLTRLTDIINAEGESYHLTYDKAGQLIAETDFTGRTLRYEYDAAGRCICTIFPDGTHLNRRYNVTDQVTDEEVTQGDSTRVLSATTFRYDSLYRLVEAKNDDATVIYEYDEAGRITAETLNGRRTEYTWEKERDYISQRTTEGLTEYFTRGFMGELEQWQLDSHA